MTAAIYLGSDPVVGFGQCFSALPWKWSQKPCQGHGCGLSCNKVLLSLSWDRKTGFLGGGLVGRAEFSVLHVEVKLPNKVLLQFPGCLVSCDVYLGASFGGRVKAKFEPELCLIVQRDKRTLRSVLPLRDGEGMPDRLNHRISVRAAAKQRKVWCHSGFVRVVVRDKGLVPC